MVAPPSLSNGGAIACTCGDHNEMPKENSWCDFSKEAFVAATMPSPSSIEIRYVESIPSSKNTDFITFEQKVETLVKKGEDIPFSYSYTKSKSIVEKEISCVLNQPIAVFEDGKLIALLCIDKTNTEEVNSSPVAPDSLITLCLSLDCNMLLQCRVKSETAYKVSMHPIHNESDKWWSFTGDVATISEGIKEEAIQQLIGECNAERGEVKGEEKEVDVISRYIIVRKEYARFCRVRNQKHSIEAEMNDEFENITNYEGYEIFKKPYAYFRKVEAMQDLEIVKKELDMVDPSESPFIEFKKGFSDYIDKMEKILSDYTYHRVRFVKQPRNN